MFSTCLACSLDIIKGIAIRIYDCHFLRAVGSKLLLLLLLSGPFVFLLSVIAIISIFIAILSLRMTTELFVGFLL